MNWQTYHSYRVFDEFLQRFVLERKSYITTHEQTLDFEAAFEDIHRRYVLGADESGDKFEPKINKQFPDADVNTKLVFAHAEYLWCMPVCDIRPVKKRRYALRWFPETSVVSGHSYYFSDDNAIAVVGSHYKTHKYHEILAVLNVLDDLWVNSEIDTVGGLKDFISDKCYSCIYSSSGVSSRFPITEYCSVLPALMHLSDPDRFEGIVSKTVKNDIVEAFGHVLDGEDVPCLEEKMLRIRELLSPNYGLNADPERKRRAFFYLDDVKPLWIDKSTKTKRSLGAARFEVEQEERALDLDDEEGGKEETNGYRIRRSGKLVMAAKKRDTYTCRACGFHFKKEIVQAHHLNPLAERADPECTSLKDLITLCPNCHYLAHYLLRQKGGGKYKKTEPLLKALKAIG